MSEDLSKNRLIKPQKGSGINYDKNVQPDTWQASDPGTYSYKGSKSSHGKVEVGSKPVIREHLEGSNIHDVSDEALESYRDSIAAHESQHKLLDHMGKNLGTDDDGVATHMMHNANLNPHEKHVLHVVTAGMNPDADLGAYTVHGEPSEAIARMAETVNGGRHTREKIFERNADKLPGETYQGFMSRVKDVHKKLQGVANSYKKGQKLEVPQHEDFSNNMENPADYQYIPKVPHVK